MIAAAQDAGAPRIVMLSSAGARLLPLDGPMPTALAAREQLLRESGLGVTYLRPSAFASNTLGWRDAIRAGKVVDPSGDGQLAVTDPDDIARVAVAALTEEGHVGKGFVNGATRTYLASNAIDHDLATFWNDNTDSQYPDALTVTAPALAGVGFASNPDGVPTDFTVQTWDGAQWADQVHVTGKAAVYRWIPFPAPVTTTQVRIAVAVAQNSFSRIAEPTP